MSREARELFIRKVDHDLTGLSSCCIYVTRQSPTDLVFREVHPLQDQEDTFYLRENDRLKLELSTLTAKVERYEKELEFYGAIENYITCDLPYPEVHLDEGKRARAALNQGEIKE